MTPCIKCGATERYSSGDCAPCARACKDRYQRTVHGRLVHLVAQSRISARKRGLRHDLTLAWAKEQWEKQNGRCKLTGIGFELTKPSGSRLHPYAPSFDRVKPQGGYTQDNVELVCTCANFAFNEFGREFFYGWVSRLAIVQRGSVS